jgi:hypothetical protein
MFVERLEERTVLSTAPTIILGGSQGNENDGQTQEFSWNVSAAPLSSQAFAAYDSLDLFLTGKRLRSLLDQLAAAGAI